MTSQIPIRCSLIKLQRDLSWALSHLLHVIHVHVIHMWPSSILLGSVVSKVSYIVEINNDHTKISFRQDVPRSNKNYEEDKYSVVMSIWQWKHPCPWQESNSCTSTHLAECSMFCLLFTCIFKPHLNFSTSHIEASISCPWP